MNTYIVPVVDCYGPWIASVKANNLHDAEERIIAVLCEKYDLDYCADLEDLRELTTDIEVQVGEFYDVEEF